MKLAILLTVYNRKDTTIKSLSSLFESIYNLKESLNYDVYMVDDGSTDGTSEAVKNKFPNIKIIKSPGNLYWSRGMNLAWKTAIESDNYDYFLWFNDDAILFDYGLQELVDIASNLSYNHGIIISGAFKDNDNNVSYGGRNKYGNLMKPNGTVQEITYMNGNLVFISQSVVDKIGIIDKIFHHGYGDYDYGLRAINHNIIPLLTTKYIGLTNRHDFSIPPYYSYKNSIYKRFKIFYSPKFSPITSYKFDKRYKGVIVASVFFIIKHFFAAFPILYKIVNKYRN